MNLTENDCIWLKKKTKLDNNKLSILAELPRDFNILVDTICPNSPLKSLAKLSFSLKSRIILFNKTRLLDISLEEKSYVADAIAQYQPEIVTKQVIRTAPRKDLTEDQCRYFLVLYGLHSQKASKIYKKIHLEWIENGFANHRQTELSRHFAIWLKLLTSIDDAGLLINSCPNVSIIEKIALTNRLNSCVEV